MTFAKGKSGNSSGRPQGIKNWHTKLRNELREDAPNLIVKLKEKALGGDIDALKFLLQAILPKEKATVAPISIPSLDTAQTLTEKADIILTAISNGSISPDIGTTLITAINKTANIIEIDELTRRIEKLEQVARNE